MLLGRYAFFKRCSDLPSRQLQERLQRGFRLPNRGSDLALPCDALGMLCETRRAEAVPYRSRNSEHRALEILRCRNPGCRMDPWNREEARRIRAFAGCG